MAQNTLLVLFVVFSTFLTASCSSDKGSPTPKRDRAFFNQFVNSAQDFDKTQQHKLSELKLLVSTEKYNMRYALFDNGKVYYEVNNLGDGEGRWTYKDGTLNIFANRMMFDLDLTLSAAAETGDDLKMRFYDRHGEQSVKVQHRPPASAEQLQRFSRPNSNSL